MEHVLISRGLKSWTFLYLTFNLFEFLRRKIQPFEVFPNIQFYLSFIPIDSLLSIDLSYILPNILTVLPFTPATSRR